MIKYLTLLAMITGLWATTNQPYVHDFGDKTSIGNKLQIIKHPNISFTGIQVTSIGNLFLYCCNRLTTVNLSGLSQLKSIGNHFLSGCTNLTRIDINLECDD